MMHLCDAIYIDTRPGGRGVYAPPEVIDSAFDYREWLTAKYNTSHSDGIMFGVAQKIHQMPAALSSGANIIAFGPFAGCAADVIKGLIGIEVDVVG